MADMPRRPDTGGLSTVSDRFGNPLKGVVNPALADNRQMQNSRSILGNANADAAANSSANAAANRSANAAANTNTPTGIASVSNNVSGLNTNVGGYTDPSTYDERRRVRHNKRWWF